VVADLQRRLAVTRSPDDVGNQDWYYGVNRGDLQGLLDYWRSGYDWCTAEAAINPYQQYRVHVEGVPVTSCASPASAPTRPHSSARTAGPGRSGTGPRSSTRWPTLEPSAVIRPKRLG
jgi:hypothetical protein